MVNFFKRGVIYSTFVISSTAILMASVPNPVGDYIGVTLNSDNKSVRINFTDNSDNEDGFKLIVNGEVNKTMPLDVKYTDLGNLECNQTYSLQILAFNDDGNSSISNTRNFNLHSTFGVNCYNSIVPSSPKDIGVTDINKSAVRISFLDNSYNEDGFIIYGDDFKIVVPKNNENINSYQYANITNLICNKSYFFKIVAYNDYGKSKPTNLKSFNINSTFNIPCPSVKLSGDDYYNRDEIVFKTSGIYNNNSYYGGGERSLFTEIKNFDNPIISCKWMFDNEVFRRNSCNDVTIGMGFGLSMYPNISSITPKDVMKNQKHTISVIIKDSKGISAINSIKVKYIDDGSDSIYISTPKRVLKIGETILIEAYVNNIIPRTSCGSSVGGHAWVDSNNLGSFDDSMFEVGHFLCYGYRASTSYTAKKKGNTKLILYANGGEQSINIDIVDANYTKDSIKKVVIDNLTNLMWQDKGFGVKHWSLDSGSSFDTSGDTAETYCKNLTWGGYSDWRIPNINELSTYIFINDEIEYWGATKGTLFDNVIPTVTSKFDMSGYTNRDLPVKCVRKL